MIGRRGFITGLVALVAAPAIVRAGSLMPVRVMRVFATEIVKINGFEIIESAAIFHREWLKDWEVAARYVTGDTVPYAGITYRAIR